MAECDASISSVALDVASSSACRHTCGVQFKDSGVDLGSHDELSMADGTSTLIRSAHSAPTDSLHCNRGHFRHHSDVPCSAKLIDRDRFMFLTPDIPNDSELLSSLNRRKDSLSKATEASSSSSSSFSIGSLSDYSISASVSDESHNQSWCSKQSSLDRRSFCSESSGAESQEARFNVLSSLSNILPRNLFFRKSLTPSQRSGAVNFLGHPATSESTDLFVPSSALILEDRPPNLPPKAAAEHLRQRNEYAEILVKAKKKEEREMKERRRELKEQLKREERMAAMVKEWQHEIIPNWNELKNSKRVKHLWENGLPPCVRGKVWLLAIGNDLNITEDLFYICLNRAKNLLSSSTDKFIESKEEQGAHREECHNYESTVELIHLDVARTFPTLGIFQKGGPFYDLLFDMLSAYTCYRPDIGYVQGMSFVAAVFLLNLDLFDAFMAFCNLMNSPVLLAFFRVQQKEMERHFVAYDFYFKQTMPKLHAHFASLDVKPNLYLIDWLYTLFSRSLPLEITCRVWDMFLKDGDGYLFDTALGLLSTYESVLLTMDFDRSVEFLTHLPEKMNTDELFKRIKQIRCRVDRDKLGLFK